MKLLLAGEWEHSIYEPACADALRRLGLDVLPFKFGDFLGGRLGRLERWALATGPRTLALNWALLRAAREHRPDAILVWRGVHVLPTTLRELARAGSVLVSYNNDDPFSHRYAESPSLHQRRLWKRFVAGLPAYHINFVYRQKNVLDYQRAGAATPHLLLPYYVPALHYPVAVPKGAEYDAVFVGHYEPDERFESIAALRASGVRVAVFGTGWHACRGLGGERSKIEPAKGHRYCEVVSAAHFALSFYSKLNADRYTRRVFELPAMGTVLVSTRTPEMQTLFEDGSEALLFGCVEELVERARWLLDHPERAQRIAAAGRQRCLASGYDVDGRMREFLNVLKSF